MYFTFILPKLIYLCISSVVVIFQLDSTAATREYGKEVVQGHSQPYLHRLGRRRDYPESAQSVYQTPKSPGKVL